MTTKFKIERPLIPNDLPQGTFEDVFYDDESYLSHQLITNTSRENDRIDRLIVSINANLNMYIPA
ncbi:hypothetical protein ABE61_00575 [Lysinibacillus sphaericus]|uniref:hypothetical protein n=1 Tax=Lysinibacillus sphaericus TaxID=1421 RepID=UPI0018CF1736|nr:hypothetical protein [Lysinibacillus sphaericus]MBG9452615.1 hypothetical protein [Lysinibacillus sphaericus]MBG9476995.1 hypothetical protein [Lysinibacillus sphaericus]MBG9592764.1 hypothetical protein [Lysinibacillus sphaericus]